MFGKYLEIAPSGVKVRYDGDTYDVKALHGNPYIVVEEFDVVMHAMREREVRLPARFYSRVATLIRLGVC